MRQNKKKDPCSVGSRGERLSPRPFDGLTLVELLAVIAIIATLVSLAVPAMAASLRKTQSTQCLSKLRSLGSGIALYSLDHGGEFPRSFHSCSGAGKPEWSRALFPYLGLPSDPTPAEWDQHFNKTFRCPADKQRDSNIWSYALNVHFELSPDGDDYEGAPATWNRRMNVERSNATILLAEPRGNYFGDHLMCHQWSGLTGARNALDSKRHGKTSNYLFVDGHAESLTVEATFDPSKNLNLWNPAKAR
ncbi:MAG: prepilin-type N-terminal cleavage/methylation domain-containing protein [Terrimicrobiaceae bacterium]